MAPASGTAAVESPTAKTTEAVEATSMESTAVETSTSRSKE
jgi:hypothetical protein